MAAAKKAQTRKKQTSKTASSSRKASSASQKSQSGLSVREKRILLFCAIVIGCGLSIITLFHLGAAGSFLFSLLSLIVGSFAYVFLIGGILLGFWTIWTIGKDKLSPRFWFAFVFLMCAWCMIAALLKMPANDPWKVLSDLRAASGDILHSAASTSCGYLGAILAGMFCSLFANAGTWIMAVIFLILSLSLFGWEFWEKMADHAREAARTSLEMRKMNRNQERSASEQAGMDVAAQKEGTSTVSSEPEPAREKPSFLERFHIGSHHGHLHHEKNAEPDLSRHPGFAMLEADEKKQKETMRKDEILLFGEEESDQSNAHVMAPDDFSSPEHRRKKALDKAKERSARKQNEAAGDVTLSLGPQDQSMNKANGQGKEKQPMSHLEAFIPTFTTKKKPASKGNTSKKESSGSFSMPVFGMDSKKSAQAHEEPAGKPHNGIDSIPSADIQKGKRKAAPAGTAHGKPDFSSEKEEKQTVPKKQEKGSVQTKEKPPVSHAGSLENYKLPPLKLLNTPARGRYNSVNASNARSEGKKLIQVLEQFGIQASLSEIHIGPSVTKFEITLGTGVRVNTITNLQNDIKLALAATDIRIEAPIPGKSAVGIEVPNAEKMSVSMMDILRSVPNKLQNLPLVFALGKDLMGESVYGRLDTMPHLLIAGATGSGKSVCVNSIICSILLRTRPDEVKLMLIDPKKVEFTPYDGVPHLMSPVITDSELASKALKVVVTMMDRRYDLFEEARVRNITSYNAYCDQNPDSHFQKMPRIVIIIDELADLMLSAPKEVEQSIQRITQLARAAGIHLIVATQRPSVNVITGVIKANIPSRIAFMVSSGTDSRTILDQAGAERLLGNGDMLFLDNGESAPRRIQGVFIQDDEVTRITDYVKKQALPLYDDAFITLQTIAEQTEVNDMAAGTSDPLYEPIRSYVIAVQKASTSSIQRRFSIGYGKAARIIDALEANGIVGPANGSKPREVLVKRGSDDEMDEQM